MELRVQSLEAHERAEDERRLAVAMSSHARIGGGSLLGTLNQEELLRLCMPERARWVYPRIQTECLVCPDEDHDAEEIVFFSFGQSNCGYLCDHRLRLLFRNVYKMYSDRMAVAPRDGQPSFKYLGPPSRNRRLELMLFPDDRGTMIMKRMDRIIMKRMDRIIMERMDRIMAHDQEEFAEWDDNKPLFYRHNVQLLLRRNEVGAFLGVELCVISSNPKQEDWQGRTIHVHSLIRSKDSLMKILESGCWHPSFTGEQDSALSIQVEISHRVSPSPFNSPEDLDSTWRDIYLFMATCAKNYGFFNG